MVIEFLGHVFWRKMFNHDYGFSSFTGFDFLRFYRLRMWWYAIDRHIWDDMRCDGMRCCVVKGVMVCDLCCAVMRWCVQWCDLRSDGMRSVMRYGDVCGEGSIWQEILSGKEICQESKKTARKPKKCQILPKQRFKALGRGFYGFLKKWHIFAFGGLGTPKFGKFSKISPDLPKNAKIWGFLRKPKKMAKFGSFWALAEICEILPRNFGPPNPLSESAGC